MTVAWSWSLRFISCRFCRCPPACLCAAEASDVSTVWKVLIWNAYCAGDQACLDQLPFSVRPKPRSEACSQAASKRSLIDSISLQTSSFQVLSVQPLSRFLPVSEMSQPVASNSKCLVGLGCAAVPAPNCCSLGYLSSKFADFTKIFCTQPRLGFPQWACSCTMQQFWQSCAEAFVLSSYCC